MSPATTAALACLFYLLGSFQATLLDILVNSFSNIFLALVIICVSGCIFVFSTSTGTPSKAVTLPKMATVSLLDLPPGIDVALDASLCLSSLSDAASDLLAAIISNAIWLIVFGLSAAIETSCGILHRVVVKGSQEALIPGLAQFPLPALPNNRYSASFSTTSSKKDFGTDDEDVFGPVKSIGERWELIVEQNDDSDGQHEDDCSDDTLFDTPPRPRNPLANLFSSTVSGMSSLASSSFLLPIPLPSLVSAASMVSPSVSTGSSLNVSGRTFFLPSFSVGFALADTADDTAGTSGGPRRCFGMVIETPKIDHEIDDGSYLRAALGIMDSDGPEHGFWPELDEYVPRDPSGRQGAWCTDRNKMRGWIFPGRESVPEFEFEEIPEAEPLASSTSGSSSGSAHEDEEDSVHEEDGD